MAGRAIWKGVIAFDGVRLPVKLYSAVQDRGVHFNLLHDQDHIPIKQRMVDSVTGKPVEAAEVRRGVEVEPGKFVVIAPEELAELEPEDSRDITVERFVDRGVIDHQWYDRPYYLGPDQDNDRRYWALIEALENQQKEGIARWVMRKREYMGTLGVHRGYLALVTTRRVDEVIPASEIEIPAARKPDPKELKMAEQLVSALEDHFDPGQYEDEYRGRLMELIEKKAKGQKIELKRPQAKAATRSLVDALAASLKAAKKSA